MHLEVTPAQIQLGEEGASSQTAKNHGRIVQGIAVLDGPGDSVQLAIINANAIQAAVFFTISKGATNGKVE